MTIDNSNPRSHTLRVVSLLALGTAAISGCTRTVAGVDNGSSSTTTAASSGAETPVTAEPTTNTTTETTTGTQPPLPNLPSTTGPVEGQACAPQTARTSSSRCVCQQNGAAGYQWVCATPVMPVSGPLAPPELG